MTITENDTTTERIAKARSTFLGIEDHGIFTGIIDMDYGAGGRQGAGTLCLDYTPPDDDGKRDKRVESTDGGVHRWVTGCLRAFGVDSWEKIPGRTVYAIIEDGRIVGFRPLETERGALFMFSEVSEG